MYQPHQLSPVIESPMDGPSCSTERIRLNVGGKVFETTASTLSRQAPTFLSTLIEDRWKSLVPGGELFIDRDPTHFSKILNYLRDEAEFVAPKDEDICEELRREAQFYGLVGLQEMCNSSDLTLGDLVSWRRDAVPVYWRAFIRYMVDDSLTLPFIYDRNNHTLAKCIACDEFQDPKCSYLFDINYTDWEPMKHHMMVMRGEITQIMSDTCANVTWDNGQTIHLPKSALRRIEASRGSLS